MKIFVIGNGYTYQDKCGDLIIDHETVNLLNNISKSGYNLVYAEPVIKGGMQTGLNNKIYYNKHAKHMDLDKRSVKKLWLALRETLEADYMYLFFPGSWSSLLGKIRKWLRKPYGLYVRGERFGHSKSDLSLLRGATAICVVVGLEECLLPHNPNVVTVAPMLMMNENDVKYRNFNDVDKRPLRLLFVGRLEDEKGIPELIEATRLLKARGVSYTMRLVGAGVLYSDLARELEKPGAPEISLVGLLNSKEDLMQQYEWADVLVLPSHHEGFPRVLFEGMLKTCVVLSTMVGGIPTLMKDGHNCLALPLCDAKAIADSLQFLACDPALMQSLADKGRQTALDVLRTRPSHLDAICKVLDRMQ
jgi:glycosyltransferase involved in cell wall biosynthesis